MAYIKKSSIFCATKPKTAPTRRKQKVFAGYDILGNIVVFKFDREMKIKDKRKIAEKFLKEHKSVRTVLDKVSGFSGRLRRQKTRWILGEKTKEVLYKENGCVFRFNVDTCYFSSRLSSERKEISLKVKKGENVLVMFGGVSPFAVVIAKLSRAERIVSVEISRECNNFAKENVKRNKVEDKVEVVQGGVRKVLNGVGRKGKFDRVIMTRPNLKDSFLDVAFSVVRKGGVIHYYGFSSDVGEIKDMIRGEVLKAKKNIRILKVKKAGEIGVRKFRWRIDFKIL